MNGEKRDEHSVELSSSSSSKLRRIQTVTSTTITAVEKVSTKRGKEVEIVVNEDEELRLSHPLLEADQLDEDYKDKTTVLEWRKVPNPAEMASKRFDISCMRAPGCACPLCDTSAQSMLCSPPPAAPTEAQHPCPQLPRPPLCRIETDV